MLQSPGAQQTSCQPPFTPASFPQSIQRAVPVSCTEAASRVGDPGVPRAVARAGNPPKPFPDSSFPMQNPRFPGNLQMSDRQLDEAGENDVNNL